MEHGMSAKDLAIAPTNNLTDLNSAKEKIHE